ncbi:DUF6226 family protein [Streptomyces sp. NBC_01445]|uniref:DUF6226 family protein n=1 Tax=Streptomyces sp. NBC_01445 TaxID=2903869 RepID=UPI002DDAD5B8|nr:DUF6226 family protein [Streptomyces sp. NBC_01445]WSE03392.1 DUF6226 family protein [Streptomyces sp. NBC_01445]
MAKAVPAPRRRVAGMDLVGLCRAVDEEFAVTGVDTPPWPDPHPGGEVRDEEYSRCLEPAKYLVLAARAEAWTRALSRLGLAEVETVADPAAIWRRAPDVGVSDAVRLHPVRAHAVPLVFGFSAIDKVPRTVLVVGAGEPAVSLEQLPDCGCDACDSGSADLLEVVDEVVAAVVTGTFVQVDAGQGREIVCTGDGWSASNWDASGPPVEEALAAARAGRSPFRVVRGTAWE